MSVSQDSERRLNQILADFYVAVDRGDQPDPQALIEAHPEFADELRQFLADFHRFDAPDAPTPKSATPTFPTRHLDLESIPQKLGSYELMDVLARGGMGIVYRARQRALNRVVAVKILLSGAFATSEDVERFQREAEAAAGLDHPNIVPIYEVGEQGGIYFLAMKLIEDGNLASRLDDFLQHPKDAARIMAQVARAVHYAHERGILHRDLKPGNILLDAAGNPYVADFGLAKRMDSTSELTSTGALVGTPNYMSPEQARGERDLSIATDIFALGSILYHLSTGVRPFEAATPMATIMQVQNLTPRRPCHLRPEIDPDLETICLKCLEKSPRDRYATANEVAEDLERWLAGENIRARRLPVWRRAWRRASRRPFVAVLIFVFAAAAIAVGSVWLGDRRRADRDLHDLRARQGHRELAIEYARKIAEADSIMATNVRHAEDLLESCDPDGRGWEWGYLKRRCRYQVQVLSGLHGGASCMTWNRDGTRMAGGDKCGAVIVWNSTTFDPLLRLEGQGMVVGLALHPEGHLVAIKRYGDLMGIVVEIPSGKEIGRMAVHNGLTFSPNGKQLLWLSKENEVIAGDLTNLANQRVLFAAPAKSSNLVCSPDGKYVAVTSLTETLVVDVDGGKRRMSVPGGKPCAAFSPASDLCVVESSNKDNTDRILHVLDMTTWKEVRSFPSSAPEESGRRKNSPSLTVGCEDDRIYRITATGRANVFNLGGDLIPAFAADARLVTTAAFASPGKFSGGSMLGKDVWSWQIMFEPEIRILGGDQEPIAAFAFQSTDSVLLALRGNKPRMVHLKSARATLINSDPLSHVAPTLAQEAVVCMKNQVIVLDTATGKVKRILGDMDKVERFVSSQDGRRVAISNGKVTTLFLTSDKEGRPIAGVPLAFRPDGALLIAEETHLTVWDGRQKLASMSVAARPQAACFLGGRVVLATGQSLTAWDLGANTVSEIIEVASPIHQLAVAPDGRRIFVLAKNDGVYVIDSASGVQVFKLHGTQTSQSFAVSNDGDLLGILGQEGQLRIFSSKPPSQK